MRLEKAISLAGFMLLFLAIGCIPSADDADFAHTLATGIKGSYAHFDEDRGVDSLQAGKFLYCRPIGRDGYAEITIYGVTEAAEISEIESIAKAQLKACHGRHLAILFYEKQVWIKSGKDSYDRGKETLWKKVTIKSANA